MIVAHVISSLERGEHKKFCAPYLKNLILTSFPRVFFIFMMGRMHNGLHIWESKHTMFRVFCVRMIRSSGTALYVFLYKIV